MNTVEANTRTRRELLAGMHEGFPIVSVLAAKRPDKQALDRTAARYAAAEQASRKHARVVHDDDIAGFQEVRKRTNDGVFDRAVVAADDHEPGRGSIRGRFL